MYVYIYIYRYLYIGSAMPWHARVTASLPPFLAQVPFHDVLPRGHARSVHGLLRCAIQT